jgi:hypothetical protein
MPIASSVVVTLSRSRWHTDGFECYSHGGCCGGFNSSRNVSVAAVFASATTPWFAPSPTSLAHTAHFVVSGNHTIQETLLLRLCRYRPANPGDSASVFAISHNRSSNGDETSTRTREKICSLGWQLRSNKKKLIWKTFLALMLDTHWNWVLKNLGCLSAALHIGLAKAMRQAGT